MARIQQPQGIAAPRGHTVMDSFKDEVPQALQNSFIAGLKTEFTGLNFPPNSCTEVNNCVFTMLGDVLRREGFNYEANFVLNTIDRTEKAIASYRWLNVGGDGETQVYVLQIGGTLYFFKSSTATVATPLSTQLLSARIDLSTFLVVGSRQDPSKVECQFSDGNGYLFVYNEFCEPFYCIFTPVSIQGVPINVQTRDFAGIEDGLDPGFRPSTLSPEHQYNLQNQGWTSGSGWIANFTLDVTAGAPQVGNFPVGVGLIGVNPGDLVGLNAVNPYPNTGPTITQVMTGNVVSYSGGNLIVNIITCVPAYVGFHFSIWTIQPINIGFLTTWFGVTGNYPSNSDVWWSYKNSSNTFDPSLTYSQVTLNTGRAPQGHYLQNAFHQDKGLASSISGLTTVTTQIRPKTGTFFQGRVWYAGVDDSQASVGDAIYYTWTENIYFSQIVSTPADFGLCYQTNDPTSETLFDLLPSDGGVIQIQGAGSIYKLFPIQNGMLVFAANGIWFITGSQGIGFTANDYTITKISAVQSVSSNTFVDVQGLPIFWNEEGIYTVAPAQQGLGLTVIPLTVGTIRTFYMNIPLDSKKYAKGAYNPITYVAQWTYRSTQETDITSRYEYDSILCFNTRTQAFYTYALEGPANIHGVMYVANPGGSAAPDPTFKYVCSHPNAGSYDFTFAEERDLNYLDWFSVDNVGTEFDSHFITGFQMDGQGLRKWQPTYVYVYTRNTVPTAYTIQGIWDYSNSGNSGQESVRQMINVNKPYHSMTFRRHRLRGHGYVFQLKFSSVANAPFDLMGWAIYSTQNTGP